MTQWGCPMVGLARETRKPAARQRFEEASLHLLGGFQLTVDGALLPLPLAVQRVLAFLCVHDRPVLRSRVAGALWAETSDERAAACLRSALWRLQRVRCEIVAVTRGQLQVSPEVAVDYRDALRCVYGVDRPAPGEARRSWIALLGDDLLPDWYDDWLAGPREAFRQGRLRALERLSAECAASGAFEDAVVAGLAAVSAEPLRETAHAAVIHAHLGEGNVAEALRQYGIYAGALASELGVEPSPRIRSLLPTSR